MSYNAEIANTIHDFLVEDDWKFNFSEDRGIFDFKITVEDMNSSVSYFILVLNNAYTVYAVSPINAKADDAEMMKQMADFICRANYGLRLGNFELDMNDGEIRYKIHTVSEENLPVKADVRRDIYVSANMFSRYAKGITGIIFTGLSAADAVQLCEGQN